MTITLEEYRRREAAGLITRPITWEPVHERRVAKAERSSGPSIKSLIGAEQ